jgi:Bacterial Ig domain
MVAGAMLLAARPAAAAEWSAQWLGQSEYPLLESGERAASFFVFKNTGTRTWTPDVVRLGTTFPNDRTSAFADETWIAPWRPTALDDPVVAPGDVGRFQFTVRAPPVAGTQLFREYFGPVAENQAWLEMPAVVYLEYTVLPAEPPRVTWTAAPARIERGAPALLRVAASDNRVIARVEFRLDGATVASDGAGPYQLALPTSGLTRGSHTLEAVAVDGAGNRARATRALTITARPNGANATDAAQLSGGFGRRLRGRATVAFGRGARLHGHLRTADGRPITGAVLALSARVRKRGRPWRVVKTAMTGRKGAYRLRVPRGPSRDLRVSYTAFKGDPQPAAVDDSVLRTRAGVRLRVSRHRVALGRSVRFRVRLRGRPRPARHVVVTLQGRQPGVGWRTFATAKRKRGRFTARYRFRRASGVTVQVRAVVPAQAGYPYARGRSPAVPIFVG